MVSILFAIQSLRLESKREEKGFLKKYDKLQIRNEDTSIQVHVKIKDLFVHKMYCITNKQATKTPFLAILLIYSIKCF